MQGESFFKLNYEGQEIEIALYEGIEMKDILEIVNNQFNISYPIVSLISSNGIIYSLKYLMKHFQSINKEQTYTIIAKPPSKLNLNRTSKKEEPNLNNFRSNITNIGDISQSQNFQISKNVGQSNQNNSNSNLHNYSNKSYMPNSNLNLNLISSSQASNLFKDREVQNLQFSAIRAQEDKINAIKDKEEVKEFTNILKFLKADNFIDENQVSFFIDQFLNQDEELLNIWKVFMINNNLGILKESLSKKLLNFLDTPYKPEPTNKFIDFQNYHLQKKITNKNNINIKSVNPSSRPLMTTFGSMWSRPNNNINIDTPNSIMTSTQALMIGSIHNLEESGLLDKQIVSSIKTLILEENEDIFKVMNSYIAHYINETQLCHKLQKLAEKLSPYFERPTSPLPRKESIQSYIVNNKRYFGDKEDVSLLIKLCRDENEFILAAFDVFEADRDNENLIDTLRIIVERNKQIHLQKNSFVATTFFEDNPFSKIHKSNKHPEEGLNLNLNSNLIRNSKTEYQSNDNPKKFPALDTLENLENVDKNNNQLLLSDSSSDTAKEINIENHPNLKSNVQKEEKVIPDSKEGKSIQIKEQSTDEVKKQPQKDEPKLKKKSSKLLALSYEKFAEINGFDLTSNKDIGMLKYLINNNYREIQIEYEKYIQTGNLEELNNHIYHIVSFQFNNEMTLGLNSNEYKNLLEMSIKKNPELMKKYEEFAETGDLKNIIPEIKILINNEEISNQNLSKSISKASKPKRFQLIKQTSNADMSEFAIKVNKEIVLNDFPLLQDSNLISKEISKFDYDNNNENKDEEEMEKLKKLLENSCEVLRDNSFTPIEFEILQKQFKKRNPILINCLKDYQNDRIDSKNLLKFLEDIIFHNPIKRESNFEKIEEALEYLFSIKKITEEEKNIILKRKDDNLVKAFWMEFESLHNIFSLAENLIIYLANNRNIPNENKSGFNSKNSKNSKKNDSINQSGEQVQNKNDNSQLKLNPYIKEFCENLSQLLKEGLFTLDEFNALEQCLFEGNQILIGIFSTYFQSKNYNDFIESLNIFLNSDKRSNFFCNKFSKTIERFIEKELLTKEFENIVANSFNNLELHKIIRGIMGSYELSKAEEDFIESINLVYIHESVNKN